MKRQSHFRKILISIIISLVLVLLGTNLVKNNAYYQSSDRKFYGFFSMIRYALIDYPVETFSNFVSDYATFWDRRYENDKLRQQIAAVSLWEHRVNELQNEVEELKKLNELKSVYSEFKTISGRVLERPYDSWNLVVTLDVGAQDGVEINDGVVSYQGLIGKVIAVDTNTSIVSLVTANTDDMHISIKIAVGENDFVHGVVQGYDFDQQAFTVRLMDSNKTILEGQAVTTSGLGGVYPSGIPFGSVASTEAVADGVGVVALIKSEVDFNDLTYIKVVKKP